MKTISKHPTISFLRSIFRKCGADDGFLNLRFLPSKDNLFIPLSDIKTIVTILEKHRSENCYFGVALRKKGDGSKQGITKIPALWVDVDLEKLNREEKREIGDKLKNSSLRPSIIVISGGGLHCYWVLREPAIAKDIPKVEEVNKLLSHYWHGDRGACDASRILRVPGTFNHKYKPARPVRLSRQYADYRNLYSLDRLNSLLPPFKDLSSSEQSKGKLPIQWEKTLLKGVPEGERNSVLTQLSGHWASLGISKDEALFIANSWNLQNKPPLSDDEVARTVDSIFRRHFQNQSSRSEHALEESKKPTTALRITTLRDVFEYPEPTYLIDPVLIEGTVSILGSYTGQGKSLLTLSIIKSVLTGLPLWGHYNVKRRGPVLLIDEETPCSFLKERLQKMGFRENLPIHFLHFQEVRLDNDGRFDELKKVIEKVRPVLVVIDSLIRVHRRKEDDAGEMSTIMDRLRKIANVGTTVLVIHHHRKGEGPMNQKLRGSSDIPGGVDMEFALFQKDGFHYLHLVKSRTKPLPPIKLRLDEERLAFRYEGVELGERDEVLNAIIELVKNEEASVSEIIEHLSDYGFKKVGEKTVRSILNEADGEQLLCRFGDRGKRFYRINPDWQIGAPIKERKSAKLTDGGNGSGRNKKIKGEAAKVKRQQQRKSASSAARQSPSRQPAKLEAAESVILSDTADKLKGILELL